MWYKPARSLVWWKEWKIIDFNKTKTFFKQYKNIKFVRCVYRVRRKNAYKSKKQESVKKKEIREMSKFVEANEKIAEAVVEGYKKIEDGVVGGYKKIEKGAVDGFTKVTDKCVEKLFTKEGETVEEAKKRLSDSHTCK